MDAMTMVDGDGMGMERCQRMARGHEAEFAVCNAVREDCLAQMPALRGCKETWCQTARSQADFVGHRLRWHTTTQFMCGVGPSGLQLTRLDGMCQS